MELLIVIGVITILIALLLPALNMVREQARYVRWQAYSHHNQGNAFRDMYRMGAPS